MTNKTRLGLYLEDDAIKKQIKIAAAKRGVSTTVYCAQAIEERLRRDGELNEKEIESKRAFLSRVDRLRKELGPINNTAAELIKEGRRR
jgi:hypothetical protein